jgi:hypothetical protein
MPRRRFSCRAGHAGLSRRCRGPTPRWGRSMRWAMGSPDSSSVRWFGEPGVIAPMQCCRRRDFSATYCRLASIPWWVRPTLLVESRRETYGPAGGAGAVPPGPDHDRQMGSCTSHGVRRHRATRSRRGSLRGTATGIESRRSCGGCRCPPSVWRCGTSWATSTPTSARMRCSR